MVEEASKAAPKVSLADNKDRPCRCSLDSSLSKSGNQIAAHPAERLIRHNVDFRLVRDLRTAF